MKLITKIIIIAYSLVCFLCDEKPVNIWKGKTLPIDFINTILSVHNNYRSKIANGGVDTSNGKMTPATNMVQLYWSKKLSIKAQLIANDCLFKSSVEQIRSNAGEFVGESIYLKAHKGDVKPELMDWEDAIESWYKERLNFDVGDISKYQSFPKTKAFTQIAWANTRFIGCGYSAFKTKSGDTNQLYICHYSPGGNIVLKEMYNSQGKVCSKCPKNYECKSEYDGLCCLNNYCSKDSIEIKHRLK